jgi:hypothetical protein
MFISGFLVPATLILVWLLHQGLFKDFIYWTIIYPFTIYSRANLGRAFDNKLIFLSIHSPILLIIPIIKSSRKYLLLIIVLITLPISFWFAIFHIMRFQMSLAAYALLFGLLTEAVIQKKKKVSKIVYLLVFAVMTINIYTFAKYAFPKYEQYFSKPQKRIMTMLYPDDPSYYVVDWIRKNTPRQ